MEWQTLYFLFCIFCTVFTIQRKNEKSWTAIKVNFSTFCDAHLNLPSTYANSSATNSNICCHSVFDIRIHCSKQVKYILTYSLPAFSTSSERKHFHTWWNFLNFLTRWSFFSISQHPSAFLTNEMEMCR